MKKYVCLLLITCSAVFTSFAQKITIENGKLNGILPVNESGKITYQVVKSVDGAGKDELYKRGRKWFVKTYNSANQVLQVNDPSTGELTGKGIFPIVESYIGTAHTYPVRHLLAVDIKEGKYRIVLTDFVIEEKGESINVEKIPTVGRKWIDKFYTKVNTEAEALVASLQKALATADDF
ncbi:DUF4468 domain-containing protein [Spirosoma arboris]|nr:DUF4468 domain-containing protein [Spirosoma arboris]